jgi:hypothetical protein
MLIPMYFDPLRYPASQDGTEDPETGELFEGNEIGWIDPRALDEDGEVLSVLRRPSTRLAPAERRIAKAQVEMAKVAEARDAARGQLARLDRGEEVSGGLGRSMTQEDCVRILKAAGRTTSDIRHAMDLAELSRIGGEQAFEDFLQESFRRMLAADKRLSKSVGRAMLRRLRSDD